LLGPRCDGVGLTVRPDELVEHLRREPFQPFQIRLTNGAAYEIRHPELMKVGRSQALIFFPRRDEPHAPFIRYRAVALLHINRIIPLEGPSTSICESAESAS